MRISDWSSDVCSSDLVEREGNRARLTPETGAEGFGAGEVAAADQHFATGKISQQFGKPSAEDAIAAENQDLPRQRLPSPISGGATQQDKSVPQKLERRVTITTTQRERIAAGEQATRTRAA